MKKYHITIIDNETGKPVHDADTDIVIGAFHETDERVAALACIESNALNTARTICGTETVIKAVLQDNPEIAAAVFAVKQFCKEQVISEANK